MELKDINKKGKSKGLPKRTAKRMPVRKESFEEATTDIVKTGSKVIIGVGLMGALSGLMNNK